MKAILHTSQIWDIRCTSFGTPPVPRVPKKSVKKHVYVSHVYVFSSKTILVSAAHHPGSCRTQHVMKRLNFYTHAHTHKKKKKVKWYSWLREEFSTLAGDYRNALITQPRRLLVNFHRSIFTPLLEVHRLYLQQAKKTLIFQVAKNDLMFRIIYYLVNVLPHADEP